MKAESDIMGAVKELVDISPKELREGVELRLGSSYLLSPAQRLAVRDLADFYPDRKVTCIDAGSDDVFLTNDRPTQLADGSWLMPGELWDFHERIPPAFSDSTRGVHFRTVRIELEELVQVAKAERYMKYEQEQLAKEKERAKRKPSKRKPSEPRDRTKKVNPNAIRFDLVI